MTDSTDARYKNFQHYIDEGWAPEPKKTFQHVGKAATALNLSDARVLDIGCATGELIHYLKSLFPNWNYVGIDLFDPLLDDARKMVPDAEFLMSDILELDQSHDNSYDVIFAVGVLSLFEDVDLERFFKRVHQLLSENGHLIVLGPMNEFGIDMMLKHRKWRNNERGTWERGWSIPSVQTVEQELSSNFSSFEISDYSPQLDLEQRDDPIRTWTVPYADKKRQLTNGLKLLVDYHLIVAKK